MAACRFIKPTKFLNLSTHVDYWFYLFPHTRSYLVYLQYPFELNAVSYTRNWKIGASIFNVPQFHRTDSLAGEEGFEPSVHGIKIRCLTNLAIPQGAPQPGRTVERLDPRG